MTLSKKEIESFLEYHRRLQYNPNGKDVQYHGRKINIEDSRDYVANNKVAQKAIRNVFGLKN